MRLLRQCVHIRIPALVYNTFSDTPRIQYSLGRTPSFNLFVLAYNTR
jgi:hypothetical protein